MPVSTQIGGAGSGEDQRARAAGQDVLAAEAPSPALAEGRSDSNMIIRLVSEAIDARRASDQQSRIRSQNTREITNVPSKAPISSAIGNTPPEFQRP
jgi:hypothetical protein